MFSLNSKRAEKHPSVADISYTFQILPSFFSSFHASLSLGHRSQGDKLLDRYGFFELTATERKKKPGERDSHPTSLRIEHKQFTVAQKQGNAATTLLPGFEARLESTKYSPCISFCGIMSAVICRPESLCKGTMGK